MRYVLKGEGMWATCDFSEEKKRQCQQMYDKFIPLMMTMTNQSQSSSQQQQSQSSQQQPHLFTSSTDFVLSLHDKPKSELICARHGAAGSGMLTDHGKKLHGWNDQDYLVMHNHGRGAMLYDFRNFMITTLFGNNYVSTMQSASTTNEHSQSNNNNNNQPRRRTIIFSIGSSKTGTRSLHFRQQVERIKNTFPDELHVIVQRMSELSLEAQVHMTAQSSFYVSICGGGAVTATFLPKGAAAIIYYDETGGHYNNKRTYLPAQLDWDLFNNAAYIRTHWMPKNTMKTEEDLDLLVELIRHELDIMKHQESFDGGDHA